MYVEYNMEIAFTYALLPWKSSNYYIFWVCVSVSLVIQDAMRMRRIILSTVACPAVPYYSTCSHKRQDSRKKKIEHKMYVVILSTTLSVTFLILRSIVRDIIISVHRSPCKYPSFFLDFNEIF